MVTPLSTSSRSARFLIRNATSWTATSSIRTTGTGNDVDPTTPREESLRNPRQFREVNVRDAIAWVTKGEQLLKDPDEDKPGMWRAKLRRVLALFRSARLIFFVVVLGTPGRAELRWDHTLERASTLEAKGRVLLTDIKKVVATFLHADGQSEAKHKNNLRSPTRHFRVVCADRTLKLWAPGTESMKLWVVGLQKLAREEQGSAMRLRKEPDGALKFYIQQLFAKVDLRFHRTVSFKDVAMLLKKLNINATDQYVKDIFGEFDKDDSQELDISEFTEVFDVLAVKDSLMPWFEKYAQPMEIDSGIDIFAAEADGSTIVADMADTDYNASSSSLSFADLDNGSMTLQAKQRELLKEGSKPLRPTAHRAMSAQRFQLFLELEQGERHFFGWHRGLLGDEGLFGCLTAPDVEEVDGEPFLTQAGFSRLLCCSENSLFDPARQASVGQDMSRPLSHYWIASSHNTYLEDDQLVGRSSLEQYMDVLLRGCRCVEIDCWDGEDGEPIVTHGWTPTTSLRFADVIRVIRDYGFVASPYPLILSLEVHCNPSQQARMAHILKDFLGPKLLMPKSGTQPRRRLDDLISPEAAKHKVLIKGKLPKVVEEFERISLFAGEGSTPSSPMAASLPVQDMSGNSQSVGPANTKRRTRVSVSLRLGAPVRRLSSVIPWGTMNSELAKSSSLGSGAEDLATRTWLLELAAVTYIVTRHFPACATADEFRERCLGELEKYCCISANETKMLKMFEMPGVQAVRDVTADRLVRVFPHARRVTSANYSPVPMWLAGIQMAALNYQKLDLPVIVNQGLFSHENGGSGYVLKPYCVQNGEAMGKANKTKFAGKGSTPSSKSNGSKRYIREVGGTGSEGGGSNGTSCFTAASSRGESRQDAEDRAASGFSCSLELTVLSGHALPKPNSSTSNVISPRVRVSICGVPEDRCSVETRQILDNGFNPRWHQLFVFEIAEPSVAIIAFEVMSTRVSMKVTRRDFVAATAMPLSGLREGIRWVPLQDWRHQPIAMCGLLVEARLRGDWAEVRRLQRLARPPLVSPTAIKAISAGPGGLGDIVATSSERRRKRSPRLGIFESETWASGAGVGDHDTLLPVPVERVPSPTQRAELVESGGSPSRRQKRENVLNTPQAGGEGRPGTPRTPVHPGTPRDTEDVTLQEQDTQ